MRASRLALLLSLLAPAAANAAELTVTIAGIRNASGWVVAAVYDSAASFGKPELARASIRLKATPGQMGFTLRDLPAGKYAVAAFHDENANGKLDRNFFGVPTEGFGFSNDARGTAGPPDFDQATFALGDQNKSIRFTLTY